MIKKILLLGILLVFVAFLVVYFRLGQTIKLGVETVGPKITQTEVRLEEAVVSPLSGKGQLKGLFVGNPEGFELDDKIFYLGEIQIEMDPKSLFSDKVFIERIYIYKPEIVYESKLGSSNLGQLLKNIEESTRSTKTAEPSETTQEPEETTAKKTKKIEIGELVIEEGLVKVGISGSAQGINIQQGVNVPLPRIELKDIGKNEGGLYTQDVVLKITQELMKSVGNAATAAGNSIFEEGDKVFKEVQEATKKGAAQDAVDKLKSLF